MSKLNSEETGRRIDIICENNGILPYTEAFYIHSIYYCASRAKESFVRFEYCDSFKSTNSAIFSALQEALTHTAALSRFFWPTQTKKASINKLRNARSSKLRDAFQVNNKSCLKDRKLRNALEHFDERLDMFLVENDIGHFCPTPIIDSNLLSEQNNACIFKLVDPINFVFVILNEEFDFSKFQNEVSRILVLAKRFDQNGSRLPF